MHIATRVYCATVIGAGALSVLAGICCFRTSDPFRLVAWVVAAILLAGVKLRIPGMPVTVAGSLVIMIAAILRLGFGEVMLIGSAIGLAQSFVNARKRPKLIQVAFSIAVLDVTAGLCLLFVGAVRAVPLNWFGFGLVILGLGVTFFLVNTILIAGIISLTENKTVTNVWTTLYSWSLPHYIAGGLLGGILGRSSVSPPGYIPLAVVTLAFLLYSSMHQRLLILK